MKISSPSRMNSLTGKVTYMNSLDCMWNITAPKDKNVVVRYFMKTYKLYDPIVNMQK